MSKSHEYDRVAGICLLITLHAIAFVIWFLILARLEVILESILEQPFEDRLLNFFISAIAVSGILQLLYLVPLCIWLKRKNQLSMMEGVIIGAVITILLNSFCFL